MQEVNQEHFYNIGVSYKKADANTRGKFSLSKENQIALLTLAKEKGFEGVFVLSTCNRTEISGFAQRPCQLIELLCDLQARARLAASRPTSRWAVLAGAGALPPSSRGGSVWPPQPTKIWYCRNVRRNSI